MTHDRVTSICETCGAPGTAGLAACSYCKTAYALGAAAIACTRCGDVNLAVNSECASCRAPLVRACVFCSSASPLASSACMRCGEAFAGAEERKSARDAQQKQAQMVQLAQEGLGAVERALANPGVRNGLLGVFEEIVGGATRLR